MNASTRFAALVVCGRQSSDSVCSVTKKASERVFCIAAARFSEEVRLQAGYTGKERQTLFLS